MKLGQIVDKKVKEAAKLASLLEVYLNYEEIFGAEYEGEIVDAETDEVIYKIRFRKLGMPVDVFFDLIAGIQYLEKEKSKSIKKPRRKR